MSQQHLEHEESTPDAAWLAGLASKKAEDLAAVEERVRQLGPEGIDALLAALRQEARKRQRRQRWAMVVYAVYGLGMLAMAVTGHMEQLSSFAGLISVATVLLVATQAQKNATKLLAEYDDPRCVGPLAEALHFQDKALYGVAKAKLMDLLPRLQASDADALTAEQRSCLCRAIGYKDPAFSVAILKALQQVGGGDCIRIVEHVANSATSKPNAATVRAAAIETLPFLQRRDEQERAARVLLRPASSPAEPSAVLLRPAASGPAAPTETLLRPAEPEPGQPRTAEPGPVGYTEAERG